MKKLRYVLFAFVALAVTLSSCNNDDDYHDYHLEYVNVTDAELPDEFILDGHIKLM